MYMCVFLYMFVCMCVRVRERVRARVRAVYVYVYVYVCVYLCVYVHVYVDVYMYMYVYMSSGQWGKLHSWQGKQRKPEEARTRKRLFDMITVLQNILPRVRCLYFVLTFVLDGS